MSLSIEAAYAISSKQKLNALIFTEAEIVAIDDRMQQVLWTWYFQE